MIVAILGALALARGVVWSLALPPWYGPDEPSHYAYVQALVENRWLPRGGDNNAGQYYPHDILCSQHNLGIGISDAFHAEPPFGGQWTYCSASTPRDRLASAPNNVAGTYFPLYYASAMPFYALVDSLSVEARLAAVRAWSVVLGVLATIAAYFAFRWAFGSTSPLVPAASVAFTLQPMNSQQFALVSNDAMLFLMSAAFWWRFYRALRYGLSIADAFILGGLTGLAYLAKPQGLFLGAMLPVLWLLLRNKKTLRAELPRFPLLVAAAAAPVAIAIGLGAAYTRLSGGALLPPALAGFHGLSQYLSINTANNFGRLTFIWLSSVWGYFGWFSVGLPSIVFFLIALLILAGLVGAIWLLIGSPPDRTILIASLLGVLIPAALTQLLEVYAFRSSGYLLLQGRAFLVLLVPAIILLARGWQRLLRRWAGGVAPALVLISLALNVLSLVVIVDAFYG